uniref:CotH kinase family protein n=1 Tax=Emticicia sp. TaxID=1930953 RepID=UPI003751D4AE
GFGNGTSGLNYLGSDTTLFQKYYTLKNSKLPKPWEYLVNTTEKLNKTDLKDLETVMPIVMDVDKTLWFLATEIMFGDDDSYVNKGAMDYYIYVDPETKRMTPIETDGNSAIEMSRATWSPFFNETKVNFPLLNRLLVVPAYRQRYLAHLRTINEESINPKISNVLIDALAKKIDAKVKTDPKALYTYAQFQAEVTTIKSFFTSRYNFIKTQVEVNRISPTLSKTTFATNGKDFELPTEKNTVSVRTTATSSEGISKVYLYFSDNLTGNFTKKEMFDDGKNNDGAAKDGVFGAEIPAFSIGKYVRYYIEAVSSNSVGTVSYDPAGAEHNVFVYQIKSSSPIIKSVAINEILASNTKNLDENKQADDWIELYNLTTNTVNLSEYYLSDNSTNLKKWQFPTGTTIAANSFLIVWADEDALQGKLHANFKLSKSGESVYLVSPAGIILDEVTFGEQKDDYGYARNPNGTGSFVSQTSTFNADNITGKTGPTDPVVVPPAVTPPTTTITATEPESVLINVYPNPANETLNIKVANHFIGKELEVYNSRGQMILKQQISNESNINTTEWISGLYFLKLANTSRKILIIK